MCRLKLYRLPHFFEVVCCLALFHFFFVKLSRLASIAVARLPILLLRRVPNDIWACGWIPMELEGTVVNWVVSFPLKSGHLWSFGMWRSTFFDVPEWGMRHPPLDIGTDSDKTSLSWPANIYSIRHISFRFNECLRTTNTRCEHLMNLHKYSYRFISFLFFLLMKKSP